MGMGDLGRLIDPINATGMADQTGYQPVGGSRVSGFGAAPWRPKRYTGIHRRHGWLEREATKERAAEDGASSSPALGLHPW
jgi:hypothetical protein